MGSATDRLLSTNLALVLHLVSNISELAFQAEVRVGLRGMKDVPYEIWSLFGRGKVVLFEKVDIGPGTRTLVFGIMDEVDFGKVARHDHGSIRVMDNVMRASCFLYW